MCIRDRILVNFRSPNEELTKYSFPSKILEYISSGSLVLSTRLLGIPDEYFSYIVPLDQADKEKVKAVIRYNSVSYTHLDVYKRQVLTYTAKPNVYASVAARQLGIPYINNVTGLGLSLIHI